MLILLESNLLQITDILSQLKVKNTLLFSYRWANTAKPYKNKKTDEICVAYRMVPEQPTIFSAEDDEDESDSKTTTITASVKKAATKYNHRKLSELSHHLIESKRWDDAQKVILAALKFGVC